MSYTYYCPDLMERWDAGDYESVAFTLLAKERIFVTIFCLDLYMGKKEEATRALATLTAEIAKAEGIDLNELAVNEDKLQSLLDKWNDNRRSHLLNVFGSDAELEAIGRELNNLPRCYLISFVSAGILLSSMIEEAVKPFYMGVLGGILSRVAQ